MEQIRVIFHIDMDSFYASIEIRENGKYNDVPLVIGIGPNIKKNKGVVSTASYKAREYGIHSGMALKVAIRKCKELVILPARISYYKKVSNNIMRILKQFSDKFEQVSIDEAYLDVSNKSKQYSNILDLANEIKEKIYLKEKLTCSIGVGPNKTIAKIASGFQKPSGITIITPEKIKDFLYPLSVKKIPGVGIKIQKKLELQGIRTIGDVARNKKSKLIQLLGKVGGKIYDIATGQESLEVKPRGEVKSIGIIRSFEEPINDIHKIYEKISEIAEIIINKLNFKKLKFKTIGIILRFGDFSVLSRSKTITELSNNYNILVNNVKTLFNNIYTDENRKIKRIGIKVSNLEKTSKKQLNIKEFLD